MARSIEKLLQLRNILEAEYEEAIQLPSQYSMSGSHSNTPRSPENIEKELARVNRRLRRLSRGRKSGSYTEFI